MGVGNLQHERTLLMARCFLRGQAEGKRSLHDGMCARCGALLHGHLSLDTNVMLPSQATSAVAPEPVRQRVLRRRDREPYAGPNPGTVLQTSPVLGRGDPVERSAPTYGRPAHK